MNEYDNEPIRGLPEDLPAGEHILWQGEPGTASMARRVFHAHKASLYFAVLIGLNLMLTTAAGRPLAEALQSSLWQAGLALAGVGLLWLLAWLRCPRSGCLRSKSATLLKARPCPTSSPSA